VNALQLALISADGGLAFALIETAKDYPKSKIENSNFLAEIAKRARLTPAEMKKLETPRL